MDAERARRPFTTDDVERMLVAGILREGERVELVHGELVLMAAKGPLHAVTVEEDRDVLARAYGEAFVVRQEQPLVLGPTDMPEPDLVVVCGPRRAWVERHPRGADAVLVVEVSVTTQVSDRAMADTYAAGGVAHYWVLDAVARRLEAHRHPSVDGRYRVVELLDEDAVVAVPGTGATLEVRALLP